MFLTWSYRYNPKSKDVDKVLKFLTFISKNIYNTTLYTMRQRLFNKLRQYNCAELEYELMKNENYKLMASTISSQIIKQVYTNYSVTMRTKGKLLKYKKKDSRYMLSFKFFETIYKTDGKYIRVPLSNLTKTNQLKEEDFNEDIRKFIKGLNSVEDKNIYLKIPKDLYDKKIYLIRIIPIFNGLSYDVQFCYQSNEKIYDYFPIKNKILSIDLGINNLVTCIDTTNKSFIIDGRRLKSVNQFYNKRFSELSSLRLDQKNTTKMQYRVVDKRNRIVIDTIKKAARYIIDYCICNQISEIVIGYNKTMYLSVPNGETKNIRAISNQTIKQIPLFKLKNKIEELATRYGIIFTTVEESYTSKCSFYDNEPICRHETYLGVREKRGLFRTHDGTYVNADINGALNILKKCKPNLIHLKELMRNRGKAVPCRVYLT